MLLKNKTNRIFITEERVMLIMDCIRQSAGINYVTKEKAGKYKKYIRHSVEVYIYYVMC